MLGCHLDITDRKRAEAQRERLADIVEASPDFIGFADPKTTQIQYINKHGRRMCGLGVDEDVGKLKISDVHPAWMNKRFAEDIIPAAIRDSSWEGEGAFLHRNGREVPVSMVVMARKAANGEVDIFYTVSRDITVRKQAEAELLQSREAIHKLNTDLEQRVVQRTEEFFAATAEAERANRAKSEFLSRTSHELRTPLNAILGFGQLLEMEENLGAEPRESVEQILQAGHHLLSLVNEVLDISNAESGVMTLALEPVPVDQLITETLSLIGSLEGSLQLNVERASPLGCGWKVLADPQRLKQVLLNLLSNAIKYNRPGGKVIVEFAPIEAADPPAFRFSVQDTGPGISPEKLPRLFTPFDRLDAERTKTHIAGTGLGLALAKRMVELMGGRIGVESVVGEGSTFWVEVPLAESPVASLEQSAPILDPALEFLNTRTLLYIEDNVSNLRLVTRILARRPAIQLLSAATGPLGLEMALEHRPDLILLDLNLPGLNGDEVLAELRADPRTSEIPVVMLTADNRPATRERMLAAGTRAFLAKPVEVRALLGVFDQFIEFVPEAIG
jgi:PAS domain S-box-containing protein